jgi:hypothetical protein
MEAIRATVNVSSVPSSIKGPGFVSFRLAVQAGFSASSDTRRIQDAPSAGLYSTFGDSNGGGFRIPRSKGGQVPVFFADPRLSSTFMDIQKKRKILYAAKQKTRHTSNPLSIGQGGKGVVVSGCPTHARSNSARILDMSSICRRRFAYDPSHTV